MASPAQDEHGPYDRAVILFATLLAAVSAQPPAWIQRAVPTPILTWREADVLGTPIVEGIAVDRDTVSHTVIVNVVDSRFDPPRIVDVVNKGKETAYLLRVRRPFTMDLARAVHGTRISPTVFSS